MSELKYSVRNILSSLSAEIRTVKCQKARKRWYHRKAIAFSEKPVKRACEERGMSRDQFYFWGKRLLELRSVEALKEESTRPLNSPCKTSEVIEKRIEKMRKAEPYLGPERLSFYLATRWGLHCPSSTVYNILKRLDLIKKKYNTKSKSKHTKRYRRAFPGYLQMDIKYVPEKIEGRQLYQISVVDHCSSWRYMEVLEWRTTEEVVGYLDRMEAACPFYIEQLQTDNAVEFTDKFSSQGGRQPTGFHRLDVWCQARDIEHKLIPVGEKEINGKVENTHRFDEMEFYQCYRFKTLEDLRHGVAWYNRRWNKRRHTKVLGWRTPEQVLKASYLKAVLYLSIVNPESLVPQRPTHEKKVLANGYMIRKKIERPKRLTSTEKYLQYLDWKKNQNWSWALLDISKIFSRAFEF